MQLRSVLILIAFCVMPLLHAQEYHWNVGVDYFFNNGEYKKSSFADSRTMHGIWLNTLGGISWNTSHGIYGGVNLLKIPGMHNAIDKTDVTLYYEYKNPKVLFRAGAFPRKEVLPNYCDFFFKDSINHYMPLMQGVFWQIGKGSNFFNAWMDWTSYSTADTRETFYLGFSGKTSKGIFFGDFQSYVFHYAGSYPSNPALTVSEQMQLMASLGLEYEAANSFKGLLSAGIFAGVERDRKADESYKPVGFTARANAELYGIGTENRLYIGDDRMRLFPVHGTGLYWNIPFLRSSPYIQSKWYVRLLESEYASVQFNCNIHFTEGHALFQQTFSVIANIGNFMAPEKKKVDYPWKRFFM